MARKKKKLIVEQPKPAGIKLPRLRQYRVLINAILTSKPKRNARGKLVNDGPSGRLKALLAMIMLYLDGYDYPEFQKAILQVIVGSWGGPIKRDRGASPVDEAAVVADAEQAEQDAEQDTAIKVFKDIFAETLRETANEVPES